MKKIFTIIIIGMLLVGIVSALAFGLDKKDFNKKVDKLDAKPLCYKISDKDKDKEKFKKCKDEDYNVSIPDGVSIYQDSQGRYMID